MKKVGSEMKPGAMFRAGSGGGSDRGQWDSCFLIGEFLVLFDEGVRATSREKEVIVMT